MELGLGAGGEVGAGGASYAIRLDTLSERALLVVATGADRGRFARRTVSALVAKRPPPWSLPAAVTVAGRLSGDEWLVASGREGVPPGWAVCGGDVASAIPDVVQVTDPIALVSPLVADATPDVETKDRLTVLPRPRVTGRRCAPSVWNWGDPSTPTAPCGSRFVMVRHRGELRVVGGSGQGILWVDGDLDLRGGFRFHGLVVVTGRLRVSRGGAIVHGAVVVGAGTIEALFQVYRSKCLLDMILPATTLTESSARWIRGGRLWRLPK